MALLTKYIIIQKIGSNQNLLINTLTSALDIVDDTIKEKLENIQNKNENIELLDEDLYLQLKQRGYIFENEQEEKDIISKLIEMNKKVKDGLAHKSYTICPTMGCNLRCTYCFEENDLHTKCQVMSLEQVDSIFRYILDEQEISREANAAMKETPVQIKLFGGEPLLKTNKEVIKRIFELSKENGMQVAIITNGTTIKEYYSLLSEYKDILQIQITVDGDKDIHDKRRIRADGKGTFDEINDNIDLILKLGIVLQYRVNVDRDNIFKLNQLKKYVDEKGWNEYNNFFPYASPVLDFCGCQGTSSLTEHELYELLLSEGLYGEKDSFFKRIVAPCIGYLEVFFNAKMKPWKTTYCEANTGNDLCFSPDGFITTCLTYTGKGKYSVGKFDEHGVYIDESAIKMWTERDVLHIEKCSECKYAFLCGGGCPVMALERNKDINKCVCSDVEDTVRVFVEHKFKSEKEVK